MMTMLGLEYEKMASERTEKIKESIGMLRFVGVVDLQITDLIIRRYDLTPSYAQNFRKISWTMIPTRKIPGRGRCEDEHRFEFIRTRFMPIPKTGDQDHPALWGILMLIGLAGVNDDCIDGSPGRDKKCMNEI